MVSLGVTVDVGPSSPQLVMESMAKLVMSIADKNSKLFFMAKALFFSGYATKLLIIFQ